LICTEPVQGSFWKIVKIKQGRLLGIDVNQSSDQPVVAVGFFQQLDGPAAAARSAVKPVVIVAHPGLEFVEECKSKGDPHSCTDSNQVC
jgi:hypothetical protein